MIASVETDVFALDLAPAAKLGRDSLFLSPTYALLIIVFDAEVMKIV